MECGYWVDDGSEQGLCTACGCTCDEGSCQII